ncbi:MAG TPA: aldehyde dehydrogenase, partial [Thermoanaerobaculia bacterium]|nr:aldehyde dehydrogenase [Thermoanaerobaculia bacterium]
MLHIPLLRGGKPYRSLDFQTLKNVRTGEPVAQVSHANAGVIARDLLAAGEARRALQDVPAAEMLAICRKAADLFATAELPVEPGGALQGPEDYVRQLSATSGLPESLCRFNMEKNR